jgi:8-oxo-dGTP pyrophosphatase MutT (NUDIX family)
MADKTIQCTFPQKFTAQLRHVVVHAILHRNGEVLLVKRHPSLLEGGKWAIPGGYTSRDEYAGESALRELQEETGWKGKDPVLFRISTNPHRRNDPYQNVGFDYGITPDTQVGEMDWESTEMAWFSFSKLPDMSEIAFDHYEILSLFSNWLKHKHALPIVE